MSTSSHTSATPYDLILAGGGLANGLIAWRLRQLRPELNVLCIDEQSTLGGNHTWSFHDGDLSPEQRQWLAPLIVQQWPSYEVHFPDLSRQMPSGYASVTSERFAEVIGPALGDGLRLGQRIAQVEPTRIMLDNGATLEAAAVIDGRGVQPSAHLALGQQAFLGQLLQMERPHGLAAPIIMDARVAQSDGYRFVYVLPFTPDTVLIEDTHYVEQQSASVEQLRGHIADYAASQGWKIARCLREEQGILPITLAGDFAAFWDQSANQPKSGLRAGLFHCTTGYSLPHAVRLADWLATRSAAQLHASRLAPDLREYAWQEWRRQGFYRLLNRMLFLAGRPQDRWQVMQRFYRLPAGLIERFYAGQSHWPDRLRVLVGKPPVPVGEAMQAALRFSPRHFESPV
jgi:lycopene beta-cyclase